MTWEATYTKTDAGRQEIRARTLPLTRPARNLLLILDAGRPAREWISMVQGCSEADGSTLLDAGLITPIDATRHARDAVPTTLPGAFAAPASAPFAPDGSAGEGRVPLAQALQAFGYRTLYDRITLLAKPQLGLFRGYRTILELERCNGPDAMRAFAQKFVEQVREHAGDAAAQAVAQALVAPVDAA